VRQFFVRKITLKQTIPADPAPSFSALLSANSGYPIAATRLGYRSVRCLQARCSKSDRRTNLGLVPCKGQLPVSEGALLFACNPTAPPLSSQRRPA